jgi:hypothetical protein
MILFFSCFQPSIVSITEPPNNIAQRQLVLIAKVLQNLANMVSLKLASLSLY